MGLDRSLPSSPTLGRESPSAADSPPWKLEPHLPTAGTYRLVGEASLQVLLIRFAGAVPTCWLINAADHPA